jgi:beta-glucanase (GH16 family)
VLSRTLLLLVSRGVVALAALAILPSAAGAAVAGPTGLEVTNRTQTALTLDWSPVRSRLYYEVRLDGGAVTRSNGQGDRDGGTSAHTWSGLACGTTHTLEARYVYRSSTGSSVASSWSRITGSTLACAPSPTPTPTPTPTPSPTPPSGAKWSLIYSDDFAGSDLSSNWEKYGATSDWPGHSGNGLRVGRAVSVANGIATITAKMVNGTLESGAFTMKNPAYRLTYGRYETRIRVDPDASQATSAVALLWNVDESAHPWCQGESDFYETGTSRDDWQTFLHYEIGAPNCSDATTQAHCQHLSDPTGWHDVALEWEPNRYAVYVDGALDCAVTNPDYIPDWAQRLTFQLDAFKPDMGSSVVRMQMDYARIYARAG